MNESRPVWAAVLPSAPREYNQFYMGRLVDVVNKLIEQLVEPRQLTAASAVFSDLPQETPRFDIEGEVYTKMCENCGPGQVLLAIRQTVAEGEQHAQRRRFRAGYAAAESGNIGNPGGVPVQARKDGEGGS